MKEILMLIQRIILIYQYFFEPSRIENRRRTLAIKVNFLIRKLDAIGNQLVAEDITREGFTYRQVTNISVLSVLNGKLKELSSELSYKNYHTARSLNYIEEKIEKITKEIDILHDELVNKIFFPTLASDYDGDKIDTQSLIHKEEEKRVDFTVPLYKDIYEPVRRQTFNDFIYKIGKIRYDIMKRKSKRRD